MWARLERASRAAILAVPLLAAAPASDPLAGAGDLFGARLGMTRAEVRARAPADCVEEADDEPERLFLSCGARNLSAGFTAAGRAWWVTASFDMTDTQSPLSAARAALLARFGRAEELYRSTTGMATLAWLPRGSRADAGRCAGQVSLLTAQVELRRTDGGAARLSSVDAGCLPLRSAILAEHAGHHGLIVQEQDPRARIAELAR